MMRNLLAGLLVAAYAFSLVMSTGHLAEWYRLTLGELPEWFAVGLAAALESSAFLLSLLSNSLLRGSAWASWGALVALGLVWVGNYFSMARAGAANGIPGYEIVLASLFVPVSTYVVAKVLGELLYTAPKEREGKTSPVLEGRNSEPEFPNPDSEFTPLTPEVTKPATSEVYGVRTRVNREVALKEEVVYERRGRRDEEFLRLLTAPRSTREVAEALGMTRVGALKRLKALEERGLVKNTERGWLVVKEV